MEDPNKNTNTNDGYSFYNTKDDHGFNDHITSNVEDPKKAITKRLVLIFAIIIVSIAVVVMFTKILVPSKHQTNRANEIRNRRNQTINQIQDIR